MAPILLRSRRMKTAAILLLSMLARAPACSADSTPSAPATNPPTHGTKFTAAAIAPSSRP